MNLTTTARVKSLLSNTASSSDAIINMIVSGVSVTIGNYLNRHAEKVARTEYYDVEPFQQMLQLRGFPVASSPVAALTNDVNREFTGVTAIDAGDYYLNLARGSVEFDQVALVPGPGVMKVVYTGGLASSTSALITAYPEIALAADLQAAWLYKRRDVLGTSGISGEGGSISFDNMVGLIPTVKEMLRPYRLLNVGT